MPGPQLFFVGMVVLRHRNARRTINPEQVLQEERAGTQLRFVPGEPQQQVRCCKNPGWTGLKSSIVLGAAQKMIYRKWRLLYIVTASSSLDSWLRNVTLVIIVCGFRKAGRQG